MQKIYIAGPMTGVKAFNYPKFRHFTGLLRAAGFTVVSPVEIGDKYGPPEELAADREKLARVMDEELREIEYCHGIFLLDGWEDSIGAKAELMHALEHGLKVRTERSLISPNLFNAYA